MVVPHPAALIAALPSFVVTRPPQLQVDTYYHMPAPEQLRIRQSRCFDGPVPQTLQEWDLLRIDQIPLDSVVLTHKRQLDALGQAYAEEELSVGDLGALQHVLTQSGILVDVVVRKHRRSFAWDEFTLELDTLPGFGTFLDVELLGVPAQAALSRITALLTGLGFAATDVVSTTYTDLVRRSAQRTSPT